MWRLLVMGVVVTGCLKANPAWDDGAGASTTTSAASTSSGLTTGEAPTRSGDTGTTTGPGSSSSSGSGEGSTTAPVATTTGESSSTTGSAVCLAFETVPLVTGIEDAGVVPKMDVEPCPWSADFEKCPPLNFGATEFYRLVNDESNGQNAALLRFPITVLEPLVVALGHQPPDVLGLRIELVVWEQQAAPAEPYTLEVLGLDPKNYGWTEGTKAGLVAIDGDSSDQCMTRSAGACVPWAGGLRATDGAVSLGLLTVDAQAVAANDQDMDADQYHARLRSDRLEGAVEMFTGATAPSFAVILQTGRDLDEQVVGVKLREAPWSDPTLYVDLCTQWSS